MRADARRNYARLLSAASAAFAERGAGACLEDIAESAGVGIGTLYRHFPTRRSLAEAVYRDQIEALVGEAHELLSCPLPADALATWLRSVVRYFLTKRGLAEFMKTVMDEDGTDLTWCRDALFSAGSRLLARAQEAGVVRADVSVSDVMHLVHGIAWASGPAPDAVETHRMLAIVLDGLRPPAVKDR
jgi:AcrR family transcriptional regulator